MEERSQQSPDLSASTQQPTLQGAPAVLGSRPQPPKTQPSMPAGQPLVQALRAAAPTQADNAPASCPTCHVPVRPSDYFCANCGTNLRPAPPSIRLSDQLSLYVKSALLPPLGLIWGFAYLRQPTAKSKMVGLTAMVITIAVLVFAVVTTISLVNTVNEQVNSQLEQLVF